MAQNLVQRRSYQTFFFFRFLIIAVKPEGLLHVDQIHG